MARQVLPIVGAVVGSFFGAPQLGFAIGSIVGNLVDPVINQGPKMGELPVQTSQEGQPISIIEGTSTCTGFIMDFGPALKTTEITEGEKGAPKTEGDVIYRNYAIGICEGPIQGILRAWENDKLVYDVRPGSLMMQASQIWISNKQGIYFGTEDQLPDVYLQLNVSGIGTTPAYRGIAYMVFGLEDLTETGGAIKQYRWEVAKEIDPSEVGEITNTLTIDTYGSPTQFYFPVQIFKTEDDNLGVGWFTEPPVVADNTPWTVLTLGDDLSVLNTDIYSISGSWPESDVYHRAYQGAYAISVSSVTSGNGGAILSLNGSVIANLKPTSGDPDNWWGFALGSVAWKHDGRRIWFSETHVYIGTTTTDTGVYNILCRWPISSIGWTVATEIVSGICVTPGAEFFTHLGNDGKMRVINDVGEFSVYSDELVPESTETIPFSLFDFHGFGVDGDLAVFVYGGLFAKVDFRSVADWSLIGTLTNAAFVPENNTRVIFTDESIFIQCERNILRVENVESVAGMATTLAAIVADMHDRSRIDSADYDVSELVPIPVLGMTITGDYTAADVITTLRASYFFDKAEPGDKLYYPLRGKAVVATLTIDDLVDVPDMSRREQVSEVPKKLHLHSLDPIGGYAPVKATNERSSPDVLAVAEATISVPVMLTVDERRQMVNKMHKVMAADAQGEIKLTIPDSFARLIPSDCIGLVLRNQVMRLRVDESEWADGILSLTLRLDRQSAYTSVLTGIPIPAPMAPPSTIVGDTEVAIMDIGARQDSEDDLHIIVAGVGTSPGWYGWALQRSLDGGANYSTVRNISTAAVIGSLVEGVPSASEDYTDTTNTVRVQLYRDTQTIESITETQFLAEGGAFALEKADGSYEVMQYLDATVDSNGIFSLTTLHRGRLNSKASAHLTGARFVMLDTASHIPMQSAWIGQAVTWRAVSLGQSAELGAVETDTYVGRSQIEWEVASLTLARDGADVITATWAPRHRFGTDDAPVASINFTDYRVTLDDGVLAPVTFDTTTAGFTYDASALGDPLDVTVAALNRYTGAGPGTTDTV